MAQQLPSGGSVIEGAASIGSPAAGQLRIDQASTRAVIDWSSFSIGTGGRVHFENGTGATLNRVLGGDPSSLLGQLTATGSLWLINPAGILVGPEGRIAVGGTFVASSRDAATSTFMAGASMLEGASAAGVINQGSIAAGGDIVLVGHMVENSGTLSSAGSATLVAADRLLLREAGADGRVHIDHAAGGNGDVSTSGRIDAVAAELRAVGGNVYALAADTSGVIRATGSRTEGGRILLVGGTGVTIGGTIDASGATGGDIAVTAPAIHLQSSAQLLASGLGYADGGSIKVGGEKMGGPGLARADRLLVSSGALLDASSVAGRGGSVILWSDQWTRFEGLIRADGAGGGGFVETSSKLNLGIEDGRVEVGNGVWLLDPRNVNIGNGGFNPGSPYPNPFQIDPPDAAGVYNISQSAVQAALNAGSDVIVTTIQPARSDPGNITVTSNIIWNGSGSLTLLADNSISISSAITSSGSGGLTLDAAGAISTTATLTSSGSGQIRLEAGQGITLGGAVSLSNAGSLSAVAAGQIIVNGAITGSPNGTGSVLLDGSAIVLNTAFTLRGSSNFRAIGRGAGSAISFGGIGNRSFTTETGSLSLEAANPLGDIVVGRNSNASGNFRISTNGGLLNFNAGRDILLVSSDFGNGRWTRVGNLGVNAPISMVAGRNVTWDVGNFADDFVEVVTAGTLGVTAGSQINLQSSTLSAARLLGRGASFTVSAPTVLLNGAVEARGDTLLSGGTYTIGNVAPLFALDPNRSFTLAATATTAASALTITTSGSGDVSLGGSLTGTTLLAVAGDRLTFDGPIGMSGSGNALVLSAGTTLVNGAGASPLSAPNGRWLSYSVSPFDDSGWEQLNPDKPNLYGRSFGFIPPVSSPGSGNRRIYSFTPVLTLVAGSGSKTYGEGNPGITATVSGLVPGDNPADAFSGSPTVSSPGFAVTAGVGSYVVTPGGITLTQQGYALNPNPVLGTVLVNPASLLVVANPVTREYGLADPALTFAASGFVNGENASVLTGALARNPGENVGLYAITQGNLAAANYTIGFTSANFTITPAALSVVADGLTKVYGDLDPALTFTASGFRLGDTAANLSGALSRTPGENVGLYDIVQGTLANPNYTIAFTPAQLRIDPALLSVIALAQTREYGLADPLLSFAASGFQFGEDASILTGALARNPGENVGSYAITQGSLGTTPNYLIAFTGNNLTITAAPLLITPADASKLFKEPDPLPFLFTASGFRLGDSEGSALTGALSRAAGEDPGIYAILPGTLASTGNYALSFAPATFSIVARQLQVIANNLAKTYGDADPALTFTATGFAPGDDDSILTGSLLRLAGENVGLYAILQGTLAAPGYSFDFTPGSLTINPALLSITVADATREYGLPDATPFAFTAAGFRFADDASILTGALVRDPGENAGQYAIRQGSLAAANYTLNTTPGSLTITPAALAIVAADASKIYGAADPLPFGFSATGFRLGDDVSLLTGALTRVSGEAVGQYAIGQGSLLAGGNYVIGFAAATFAITPAALSIVADSLSKTYGDLDPALTFAATGFVAGDTAASALTGSLLRDAGETVAGGPYAVRQGTLSAANYTISFTPGSLGITPAALSVVADDIARVYGDLDPALTYSASGFRFADDATTVLSGALARDTGEDVGLYAISIGSLAANSNYSLSFTAANFTITPAALSVVADGLTKVYGDLDPALTFTASGFRLGDTAANLSGALSRTPGENVGLYDIVQGTLANPNYTIAFTPAQLRIDPALLSVIALAQTREYGLADPRLSFAASGFQFGEDASILTGALARNPGENVGSYAITQGSLGTTPNYLIAFTGNNLTITAAALAVSADALAKIYGSADPALSFSASGFRLGDTAETVLSGALVRAPGETVAGGPYAISAGTLAANANYSLAFTGADFTITPAALSIVADNLSKVYGDADPMLTFNASGFQFADSAATILSGALSRTPGETVAGGPYAIMQGSLTANSNYAIAFQNGQLDISRRLVTITLIGDVRRSYDATVVASLTPLNIVVNGVLPSDSVSANASSARYDTPDAGSGKLVTANGFILNGPDANNYTAPAIASAAIGTVTPAPLIARALDAARPFGLPNPPLLLSLTGLFGADTASSIGLAAVTTATAASPPGDYAIDVFGSPLNYSVTRVPGLLSVSPTPAFARVAPELIEIPALGGNTQLGVGVGVTALSDTLAAAAPSNPRLVFNGPRYSIAVQPSPPPAGSPAGASAFDQNGID